MNIFVVKLNWKMQPGSLYNAFQLQVGMISNNCMMSNIKQLWCAKYWPQLFSFIDLFLLVYIIC